ncbi:MAG: 2-C-methyl-D-erythritol 4-phosphate cytidylyltransferase [Thermodesulfovibrionales bacterium]
MREKVIAIVPAAGAGKRFGSNKPFHLLLDVPLIIWPLRVLNGVEQIEEIIPVLKESDMEKGVELFERFNLSKIKRIAPGGKERQDSVYNALRLIKDKKSLILIHDGARPLIDDNLIIETIRGLGDYDGIITGVPVKDTIKEVRPSGGDNIVIRTPNRETLWAIQTPQVFRYEILMKAYEEAMNKRFYSTDDAALVESISGRIKVIMGRYDNIKVTTPEDIAVIEGFKRMANS